MGTRYARTLKKEKTYDVGIDTIIERLKKMRALNCNPSDVGLDGHVWKKFFSTRSSSALTRAL